MCVCVILVILGEGIRESPPCGVELGRICLLLVAPQCWNFPTNRVGIFNLGENLSIAGSRSA